LASFRKDMEKGGAPEGENRTRTRGGGNEGNARGMKSRDATSHLENNMRTFKSIERGKTVPEVGTTQSASNWGRGKNESEKLFLKRERELLFQKTQIREMVFFLGKSKRNAGGGSGR